MDILSEKQKSRIKELNERNERITKVVLERMSEYNQPIPLNLVLESRFNVLMKAAIVLEAEIDYLKQSDDQFIEGQIEVKKRRLDIIKAQINELNNVGDMVRKYTDLGREFDILPI